MMVADLTLSILQADNGGATGTGIFRFFAALVIILTVYIGAWGFTYWISKDE